MCRFSQPGVTLLEPFIQDGPKNQAKAKPVLSLSCMVFDNLFCQPMKDSYFFFCLHIEVYFRSKFPTKDGFKGWVAIWGYFFQGSAVSCGIIVSEESTNM